MGGERARRSSSRLARMAPSARRDDRPGRRARAPGARRAPGRVSPGRGARDGRRSLAPDLFAAPFGGPGGTPPDGASSCASSTAPIPMRCAASAPGRRVARTLFCVRSKSGSTTEPNAFHAAMAADAPALDFIAITDPDTLARRARARTGVPRHRQRARRTSVAATRRCSVFGSSRRRWRAWTSGSVLDRAATMAEACRRPGADNPACALGAAIGEAAQAGRRQAHHPHLGPPGAARRLDRAARGREHRQGGHRHRADRAGAARRGGGIRRRSVRRGRDPGRRPGPSAVATLPR